MQKWYLFYFYGEDSEVNINTDHNKLNSFVFIKIRDKLIKSKIVKLPFKA